MNTVREQESYPAEKKRAQKPEFHPVPSRPLLDIALFAFAFEHLAEAREGKAAAGEVDGDEPEADHVDEVVEEVGVGDAVDGGVDGEEEEEQVAYVPEAGGLGRQHRHTVSLQGQMRWCDIPGGDSRDHFTARQGLDEQDERHYGKNIMVG